MLLQEYCPDNMFVQILGLYLWCRPFFFVPSTFANLEVQVRCIT